MATLGKLLIVLAIVLIFGFSACADPREALVGIVWVHEEAGTEHAGEDIKDDFASVHVRPGQIWQGEGAAIDSNLQVRVENTKVVFEGSGKIRGPLAFGLTDQAIYVTGLLDIAGPTSLTLDSGKISFGAFGGTGSQCLLGPRANGSSFTTPAYFGKGCVVALSGPYEKSIETRREAAFHPLNFCSITLRPSGGCRAAGRQVFNCTYEAGADASLSITMGTKEPGSGIPSTPVSEDELRLKDKPCFDFLSSAKRFQIINGKLHLFSANEEWVFRNRGKAPAFYPI